MEGKSDSFDELSLIEISVFLNAFLQTPLLRYDVDDIQKAKTYNRRDSQMVTHSSTSRPVQCLCMAERTGCPVLTDLWSYVFVVL